MVAYTRGAMPESVHREGQAGDESLFVLGDPSEGDDPFDPALSQPTKTKQPAPWGTGCSVCWLADSTQNVKPSSATSISVEAGALSVTARVRVRGRMRSK